MTPRPLTWLECTLMQLWAILDDCGMRPGDIHRFCNMVREMDEASRCR